MKKQERNHIGHRAWERRHSTARRWPLHLATITIILAIAAAMALNVSAAPSLPPKQSVTEEQTTPSKQPSTSGTHSTLRLAAIGGPDGGGYVFADSNEPGGPQYDYQDISATGISLQLGDDEMSRAIPLGFSFEFYGSTYSQIYVCANGFTSFLPDQACAYSSTSLPTADSPNGIIAAWWADLDPSSGGSIQYQTLGTAPNRRFILQFTKVPHYSGVPFFSSRSPVTFQLKLYERSGFIEVHYVDAATDRTTHTAGIENQNGTSGLEYYRGSRRTLRNIAVRYWRPSLVVNKTVSDPAPSPGDNLVYSIIVFNSLTSQIADAIITDTLPQTMTFAGPVTLTPPQPGANLASSASDLPVLASNVTIPTMSAVTLTLPVTLNTTARGGSVITNTATVGSSQANISAAGSVAITVDTCRAQVDGNTLIYESVQQAIDIAPPGSLIKIAGYCPGVMNRQGLAQTAYVSKTLSLRGGYSQDFSVWDPETHPTTLDAMGLGRVLYVTGSIDPTFAYLNVTGGNAYGLAGDPYGDDAGGGIYVITATATIRDCTIYGNHSEPYGWGGGIYLRNSAGRVINNTIQDNSSRGGGGIELDYCHSAHVERNRVISNTARDGGGVYLYISNISLQDNAIRSNIASYGGGMLVYGGNATFLNTLIADNQGLRTATAAYVSDASPQFINSTFARNTGGDGLGIRVTQRAIHSTAAFTNTILISHTTGIRVDADSTATLAATLWGNNEDWTGNGALTHQDDHRGQADFVAPDKGDYHIRTTSAALDSGRVPAASDDIDGDSRIASTVLLDPPDLGVDENISLTVFRYITSSLTFGAAEARLIFTDTGSLTAITITMVSDFPTAQTSHRPVARYYVIKGDSTAPLSGTLVLHYTQDEFNRSDITDESTLQAYREVGNQWYPQPSVVDTVNNIVTVTQVTGFSRWALGAPGFEPSDPTAVTLVSFSAAQGSKFPIEIGIALVAPLLAVGAVLIMHRGGTEDKRFQ